MQEKLNWKNYPEKTTPFFIGGTSEGKIQFLGRYLKIEMSTTKKKQNSYYFILLFLLHFRPVGVFYADRNLILVHILNIL